MSSKPEPPLGSRMVRRFGGLALGTDATHRVRVQRTALALAIYGACAMVVGANVRFGYIASGFIPALVAYMLAGPLLFYAAVRSGWSLRFRDPALTLSQHLYAVSALVLAYPVNGSFRGLNLMLAVMLPLFSFLALSPLQMRLLAGVTLIAFGLMMTGMVWIAPQQFDPRVELLSFVNIAVCVPCMTLVLGQAWSLRARVRAQRAELAASMTRIEAISSRDELTGLPNRHRIGERLDEECRRAARLTGGPALCVALLDLDHFKRINDSFGHARGDEVLRRFARVASAGLPGACVLGRWGGEEFLLLMPNITARDAEALIEAVRRRVADPDLHGGVATARVTFSAGLAIAAGTNAAELLERADQALYRAKAEGRDRTVADRGREGAQ